MQDRVLKITFIQDIDINKIIISIFYENITTNTVSANFYEILRFAPRTNNNQIQIYDPSSGEPSPYTNTPGEYTAERFAYYANLDKPNWVSSVENFGNEVIIKASNQSVDGFEYKFLGMAANEWEPDAALVTWNDESLYISYQLLDNSDFFISNINFSETIGQHCFYVDIEIESSDILSKIEIISGAFSGNGKQYTPASNPELFTTQTSFKLQIERGTGYKLKAFSINETGVEKTDIYPNIGYFSVPNLLSTNFTFPVISGNSGFSVLIINEAFINQNDIPLELEYSLDNQNWFSESIISGQEEGNYTIWIRDQFGCTQATNFTIENPESAIQPFHFISEANSIDYSLVENIDNCNIHPNYNNSRNRNSLNKMIYSQDILFNTCDEILTQFKTNFNEISVVLEKHGEDDQSVPVLQRTNNFNIFESLDCNIYEYSPNLAGIYFTTGNTYNEAGVILDSHELNGSLPDFVKINQLITINNFGSFMIQDILFDENIDKNVFIIQNNFVSLPSQEVISCAYDLLNYNVFEFGFNFNTLGEGMYRVKIKLDDDFFDEVNYISENIYVKEKHENTLCIDYYNQNNRDIFYKFGIKHRIRVNYLKIDYDIKEETLNNLGDNKSELVKSIINKKDNYTFDALTEKRRMTLILALSSEFCFINGVGYIKEGSVNINHIENTNLAEIEQELVVSNISYNLKETDVTVLPSGNISSFIVSGINFLNV